MSVQSLDSSSGGFAAERGTAGDIDGCGRRCSLQHGAAVRRSAANAGSVMLTADGRG